MPRPISELMAETEDLFGGTAPPTLDRWCGVVAGLADPPGTSAQISSELDTLAEGAPSACREPEDVLAYVFVELGFRGNETAYYSAENSYLHRVLATRRGIPITLTIVVVELGRRLGIGLTPVGFPSHFLIGDSQRADRWFDPFEQGRPLDLAGCQTLLHRFYPGAPLQPSHTRVARPAQLAHRMLSNLKHVHLGSGNLSAAVDVARLSTVLPEATTAHELDLLRLLAETGRFEEAAAVHERLALLDEDEAANHRRAARLLRARLN